MTDNKLTTHVSVEPSIRSVLVHTTIKEDDDCIYCHFWGNNVVIVTGTLSSFVT